MKAEDEHLHIPVIAGVITLMILALVVTVGQMALPHSKIAQSRMHQQVTAAK